MTSPEAHREAQRRWIKANPKKAQEIAARYYAKNIDKSRERMRLRQRAFRAEHRDLARAEAKAYRARRRGAPEVEVVLRADIIARDKGRCHLCGKRAAEKDIHLDHIVPLSRGGSHTAANIAVAHARCNRSKGARAANEQLRLIG